MSQSAVHSDVVASGELSLPVERCLEIHRLMVRARVMELRMIKMSKSGEGYFWIGGPGEEAFNTALGLQVNKGEGPRFDYLHLHYRNSATMLAMGMPMTEAFRQMAMTRTDTHSMGRNFPGHYAKREWNVIPVTSVIEIQFSVAPGTAMMQKRAGGDGITIVIGGDAGSAEGDFATCMVWSTRPANPLPVLMIVMNNAFGISTPYDMQHGERNVSDRGKAFGIPGHVCDGNDPIESWHAIRKAMKHCRTIRTPYMLEPMVARLHGHSSSSGASRIAGEFDCITAFEERLLEADAIDPAAIKQVHEDATDEAEDARKQVLAEPQPTPEDINLHVYADSDVDAIYPGDYTGLPQADAE